MSYDVSDYSMFKPLIGQKLVQVSLDQGKDYITFELANGQNVRFGVEGECCSYSWIEHLTVPPQIKGATITSVEEFDMAPWDNHECTGWGNDGDGNDCGHDSLAVYHTAFRTTKGDIILEYRNDSNGYYGGCLVEA